MKATRKTAVALLVRLLGEQDAVFVPLRTFAGSEGAAVYEARKSVLDGSGLPWRAGGVASSRKSSERLLEALEAWGLVLRGAAALRTSHVRLTSLGDELARRVCGLPELSEARALCAEVFRLGGIAWEPALAGTAPDWSDMGDVAVRRELIFVEEMSLPGLVRGWLDSASTTGGHVRYAVTARGRDALSGEPEQPALPEGVQAAPELREAYYKALKQARARMVTSPRLSGEIGLLPIHLQEKNDNAKTEASTS